MFSASNVIVVCPDTSNLPDRTDKTVLMMRDADSRPGYVTLELVNLGQSITPNFMNSLVPVGGAHFLSSEMYARSYTDVLSGLFEMNMETHGPASALTEEQSSLPCDLDCVHSFRCNNWPREANEWVSRPRLYQWPNKELRGQIVHGGCHVVPVGDKTSSGTFLQWRISFTTAERKLIYSLTHAQFLVYGLLKYFLKQISDMLKQIIGDKETLSSYILKTVIFHAVENTPASFWQEKYTFLCFMFCLKLLITWVKAGYCPNYFITTNNMFLGKVHGENQQNLLLFLTDHHDMNWKCLSVGSLIRPSIGYRLNSVTNGEWKDILPPPTESERKCDVELFSRMLGFVYCHNALSVSLALLSESRSDLDEFIAYICTAQALSYTGVKTFSEHAEARGNKERYTSHRKCKTCISPLAAVSTGEGLLRLATYHYLTGNYTKTLEMCRHMMSSFKIYFGFGSISMKNIDRYEHTYCGRGYTLLYKCQQALVSNAVFVKHAPQYCPSQLHHELTKLGEGDQLRIPPLPYAVFLSFLCYHELNDIRKRDTALIQLRAVKYDEEQGGAKYWIVHNLLGICFEMVGDKYRALREYRYSLGVRVFNQYANPAMDRITRLQHP